MQQTGMDSKMCLLLLLLSLDMALVWSNKIPYFGLFVPPDLYYPSTDTFCLHTSRDLQGFSQISVDLKTSSGSVNLYTVRPDSPPWHCQSFQVPEPSDATEKATIVVQGQKNEGNKIEFSSKELTLRKKNTGTFIQTDKPIYKPGQQVGIRLVTLDQDMEVLNKTYPLVELQDPQKNRLAQWKDVRAESGIGELSYQLSPETQPGKFNIKAEDTILEFNVDTYVLPKFEVNIEGPSSISMLDNTLTVSLSARYTYGEKVAGNVTLNVSQKKRPVYWGWWISREKTVDKIDNVFFTQNAKTDSSGKLQSAVDLSQFRMRDTDYERELVVEASLEEEGTGVKFSAPKMTISIKSELTKLSFKDTKRYYQPGAPYRGKLVLESHDGKRIGDKIVHLSIQSKGNTLKETYVTDSVGEVSFQLPTKKWGTGSVSLRATTDDKDESYSPKKVSIRYGNAYLYLDDIHVTTDSSVYIHPIKSSAPCHENVLVTVDYTIEKQEEDDIEFFYLVLVKNKVSLGGQKKVKKPDSLSGSFQFPLPVVDISPSGKLLVFTVSKSGGIAADTTEAQVTACLKHKVSLRFSEAEALPGSDMQLHLQANGGSLCALRAVDKSVVLMKPEAELTESKLQNLVQAKRSYIPSQRLDYNYCQDKKPKPPVTSDYSDDSNSWGGWGWSSYPKKKKDYQNVFQDMGLYILFNWNMVAPTTCETHRYYEYEDDIVEDGILFADDSLLVESPVASPGRSAVSPSSSVESIDGDFGDDVGSSSQPRTFFPETWLWLSKKIPDSGSAELQVSVPDTITEWITNMFCVGPGGVGLSSSVSLTAFQPFFVEVTLPYSIKRGESSILKASIFNYMSEPMKIAASMLPSDQFTSKNSKTSENVLCLPGGEKRTISWEVTSITLGQINITVIAEAVKSNELCEGQEMVVPKRGSRDVVVQSMLVVPEGAVVEQTHNSLLICDGNTVSEKVKFELPSSYVPGSEKAFISVCGDIMGPSLSNIRNLLQMSYGCGEQNMILFAPNVYILQYLKTSDQLNPTVLAKGKDMLEKGYTRQLMYKREDGSYSAFGNSDPEGSVWLTAFVLKSFKQAKDIVFIDEEVISQGMNWLKKQQKPDGCFKTKGRVLHNGMKGGVDDVSSLTAYVVSALLEDNDSEPSDPIVEMAMNFIANDSLENASPYKLALMAYAFTLAKMEDKRAEVMKKLEQHATKADGLLYWSQETKSSSDSYWSKPKSVDVEMTSYALLSLASTEKPTKKELGDMAAIVRWLSKQQNAKGGYSSTQDTVVALQALSKFAGLTSSKAGEMTVDVTTENGFHRRFLVDNNNRLLLQKEQLPQIPGEYTVTVSGNGTLVMQAVQRHNILPDAKEDAFILSAKPQCIKNDLLQIALEFKYTGKRQSTNMVLLRIDMLSGFEPDKESADKLKKNPMVKRVEVEEDSVSIYLQEVTSQSQTLELQAQQKVPVSGLKPAIIKIYDYYMPEEGNTISYEANC
ncbi:alpha-2-macroglobulin-like protein 1 isoform X2 [Hyla sarda]|uniref:alpha-2-macroglobulin-like protein 1 isoform X2 n=1 Tax=Hyla sarda TaxID=327740 RepID=UPI0024C2E328|nr:alpha-2-macroglobulin-like protein 1 isoform X2 [Hyla sarda]